MAEQKPIEDLLGLSNDEGPIECPILDNPIDSEECGDLLSPLATPPNKYVSVDAFPNTAEQSLGKQDDNEHLTLPEGSPVTPQLQESSMILSEMEFESHEHLVTLRTNNHCTQDYQASSDHQPLFASSRIHAQSDQDNTVQLCLNNETDFQELLELGQAMNLPGQPEVGRTAFYSSETGSSPGKQGENIKHTGLVPFALDDFLVPQAKEDVPKATQNHGNQNPYILVPTVTQPVSALSIGASSAQVSSVGAVNTQIDRNVCLPVSEQRCNANPTDIDDVLHEMASRNSGRCKGEETKEELQSDEISMETDPKKRKVSSSSRKNGKEEEGHNRDNSKRSISQRKRSSKKGKGNGGMVAEGSGKAQTSPSCTPSRFCHICTRAVKPEVVLVCGNVARGTCRKVICFKCIRDMSWDWGSLEGTEPWTCTHCRSDCPSKAQCHTYRRVNQNRRADGRRLMRKTVNATHTKMAEGNEQINK